MEAILEVGLHDSEPWVSMLADLMRTFPSTGQLNTEVSAPDTNRKIYMDLLSELRKTLKKHGDQTDSVLPLECHFLNKNAFISVVGHQPQVTCLPHPTPSKTQKLTIFSRANTSV